MKKKIMVTALAAAMTLSLAACGSSSSSSTAASSEPAAASSSAAATSEASSAAATSSSSAATSSSSEAAAATEGGEYTVVYLSPSTASEYWQSCEIGMTNAALDLQDELGITINFSTTGPATEAETEAYLTAFESTIASAPDAIITATLEPNGTVEKSKEATEQGIYVNYVSMGLGDGSGESDADWEPYYGVHYYCDNYVIGQTAAECMLKAWEAAGIEPKGYVGMHMSVVVETLEKRMQGFVDYMAENAPDVVCIDTLYNENDVNNAQANVENQISTYGSELIGLYGGNNISGDGIANALRSANITTIPGIAVDSDAVEVQALQDGYFYAIVAQTPYEQGYNCMVNAITYLMTGENTAEAKHINCPSTAVTADMMNDEEYAALLDPTLLKR